jgi:hypothetical protein
LAQALVNEKAFDATDNETLLDHSTVDTGSIKMAMTS